MQEEGLLTADWVGVARGYFQQQTRVLKGVGLRESQIRAAQAWHPPRGICCEQFGTFTARDHLEQFALLKGSWSRNKTR